MPADDTVVSFPTYAALTETQGWSRAAGAPVSAPAAPEVPADARYTQGALLGAGGMGEVLLAHDDRIGRDVALKQLRGGRELGADERARFLREARVQGQLEHPSIVPVYDIDRRADGTTFFTMRRVVGRTLAAILDDLRAGDAAARARYTQRELLTAFATICLTIDYAHSRGVIHRDLKPANVMLGDFGEVYVLDWGLARLTTEEGLARASEAGSSGERLSLPGEMMGTPLYMAPEQMVDPAVGPEADVWSLGAILFEILTLERLRDARSLWLPAEARPSVRAPARGVAPELETICVRATQTDPRERYATPRALQEAVLRYLEGDRELERRRELAGEHAARARAALARLDAAADPEAERAVAMRELVRAIALDPAHEAHVANLAGLMAVTPKVVPAPVWAELRASEQGMIKVAARYTIGAVALWVAFLPLALLIGLRAPALAAAVLVPAGLAAALAAVLARRAVVQPAQQLLVFGLLLAGAMATTTMYGPLMLTPTLVATMTIVLQAHPQRRLRLATLGMGCAALVVPVVSELLGVGGHAYAFEGERMAISSRVLALPAAPTLALLLAASVLMTVVPSLLIGRLSASLTDAQTRLSVQAWHFRQLAAQLTVR